MSNPDEELDLFSFAEAQEAEKTAEESAAAPAVPAAGAEETPPAADPESGLTFPARGPAAISSSFALGFSHRLRRMPSPPRSRSADSNTRSTPPGSGAGKTRAARMW